jgi:hypothetical protein
MMAANVTMTGSDDIGSIIDLNKFPIAVPGSDAYKSLVARLREELASVGSASLVGFVREEARSDMAEQVCDLPAYHRHEIQKVFRDEQRIKLCQHIDPAELTPYHALFKTCPQDVHAVAADAVSRDTLIWKVYDSPVVSTFLADVLKIEQLYKMDDEFQCLNIMYIKDGGNRAWHYDGSDFVCTLCLQQAEEGGEFQFAPFIRGELGENGKQEQNWPSLKQLFLGNYPTQLKKATAGTLNVFCGNRSMHRVRTVYGPKKRIMAVLSYDGRPDKKSTANTNIFLYGDRIKDIYAQRASITEGSP